MQKISAYHRPSSLEEALALLDRSQVRSVPIAGGTTLVASAVDVFQEVVDLQAIGLDAIEGSADGLRIGAMTRLQDIVDDERVPELLRAATQREGPNTFRNAGTLGGAIVEANWESELLAALLVLECELTIQDAGGARGITLANFLVEPAAALKTGLLTQVLISANGETHTAHVARTPADRAIVSATVRKLDNGEVLLALSGVAEVAVLVVPDEVQNLQPPGDFRGSSDYRRSMATVLTKRVLASMKSAEQNTP